MEEKQKINCSVHSCQYNENEEEKCSLKSIHVSPTPNSDTQTPDESMCASYEYDDNPNDSPNDPKF